MRREPEQARPAGIPAEHAFQRGVEREGDGYGAVPVGQIVGRVLAIDIPEVLQPRGAEAVEYNVLRCLAPLRRLGSVAREEPPGHAVLLPSVERLPDSDALRSWSVAP